MAGVDLTFSAPKSASVLFALGGPEVAARVADAHRDAVAGAVAYVERHALGAARHEGTERLVIPTSGMVAGVFTHAVNRNHDPHLHSHVVMANLVHGADGRWGACDRRGLEAHRAAAGAVYAAHLRAGLGSALGVGWTRPMAGPAEIVGIAPELRGEFSSRSADIRRHVAETGTRTARGRRVAWAVTRPAKAAAPEFSELAAEWTHRARAVGCDPAHGGPVGACCSRPGPRRTRFRRRPVRDAARRCVPARCRARLRHGRPRRRTRARARAHGRSVAAGDRGRGCGRADASAPRRDPGAPPAGRVGPAPARSGRARGVAWRGEGDRAVPRALGAHPVPRCARRRAQGVTPRRTARGPACGRNVMSPRRGHASACARLAGWSSGADSTAATALGTRAVSRHCVRSRSGLTSSRQGARRWAGVRATSAMALSGPSTSACPGRPRAIASTGSRGSCEVASVVEGRMRPHGPTERLSVSARTL